MKIAFLVQPTESSYPPNSSIGIVNYEMARRLAKNNQVIIYSRGSNKRFRSKRNIVEGIELKGHPKGFDNVIYMALRWSYKSRKKLTWFSSPMYFPEYVLRTALDIRRKRCDIVHIHNFSQFPELIRRINPNIKIVLNMHCEWLSQLDPKTVAKRLSYVDLIVGVSDHITNKVKEKFPQFADRCITMYNGADIVHFEQKNFVPKSHEKTLLFVGRVTPEKGLHILLEAYGTVLQEYPNIQLIIVGDTHGCTSYDLLVGLSGEDKVKDLGKFFSEDYYTYLLKNIPQGATQKITFTGRVSQAAITKYYAQAHLLIQPSFSDACPVPVIEAMASGLPVIGSNAGGIPELVADGKTGVIVQSGDVEELAMQIINLLRNNEQREIMAKMARHRAVLIFSWDKIAKMWEEEYRRLLKVPAPHTFGSIDASKIATNQDGPMV